jgi:hypothetical protein
MKLIRHPRSEKRVVPLVLREVDASLAKLATKSASDLGAEVSDWSNPPTFKYDIIVTKGQWTMVLKWDRRTKAAKIYDWVSNGTGARGDDPNASAYIIRPRKADFLRFSVPTVTKTTASSGQVAPSTLWNPGIVQTGEVLAPGIFPRHLGEETYTLLKSRKPGSFHNTIEAAVKRGFRKAGVG